MSLHRVESCNRMNNSPMVCETQPSDNRYLRNAKDDMKDAIDALYDFKAKLDKLHPSCVDLIHNMLQQQKY